MSLKLSALIVHLVLCFGAFNLFGQAKTSSERFVTVELIIPDEGTGKQVQKLIVPISTNIKEVEKEKNGKLDIRTVDKKTPFEPSKGGSITLHCSECPLTSEYSFFTFAKFISENDSEMWFKISFANQKSCNKITKFRVVGSESTNIELKCGVRLTAYYSQKPEDQE